MATRNAHYGGLLNVAQRLHRKDISPIELTEHMLKRIAAKDKRLKSYATVTADLAMKQAKKAEAGNTAGPHQGAAPWRAHRGKGPLLHQRHHHGGGHGDPQNL